MSRSKSSTKLKSIMNRLHVNRENVIRVAAVAILFAVVIITLLHTTLVSTDFASDDQADYTEYTHNEDDSINTLINGYYTALANNDADTLKTLANPISDAELSYIEFMSQCVETYYVEDIYVKDGPKDGTYLASVVLDYKFYNINTLAPGLDFLFLDVNDDGALYINNVYGAFNSENLEYETDPEISESILAFEQEDDVQALEAEVQEAFNEAILNDNDLSVYVSETLQNELTEWASQYKIKILAAIGELSDTSDETSTEANGDETAETDAPANTVVEKRVTDTVNMRSDMSETADRVTLVYEGTKVTVLEESTQGWTKVQYNDYTGYIKSEYLD